MATDTQTHVVAAKGGSFLIEERALDEVFTPEDFSDEQRMIGETATDFMEKEMLPRLPEILALNYETTRGILRKAGELGLLGVEVPEEYGGLGLDKVSGCLVVREGRPRRQLRRGLHGPHRDRHAPHRLLRHRGAEEEVPAQARLGRVDQLVLPLRGQLRQRRHERQGEGRPLARTARAGS